MDESWAIRRGVVSKNGTHEWGSQFESFGPNWVPATPDFSSQQFTANSDNWPHHSTSHETATANDCYTLNSKSIPQPDITTPSHHNSQFLDQLWADCEPLLLPPSVHPTTNDWANQPIPEAMPRLDAVAGDGIDRLAQDPLWYSPQAPDLNSVDCFGLDIPDEVPNGFDAVHADTATPFGQQAVAPPLVPYQRYGDDPLATNVPTPYRCMACSLHFKDAWDLESHCERTNHRRFACPILDCEDAYHVKTDLRRHIQGTHQELRKCNQCQVAFDAITFLGNHASETGHASFFCPEEDCGKTYSRFDVFLRHLDTHRSNVRRFPCQHCRKYRGANGFKRKDHLTQHLRNYHHIGVDDVSGNSRSCPHEDCPEWRPAGTEGDQHAFQKGSDYIAHMRKVHKESEFPCTEPGCDRTGPKGYFRMRDFQKHKLKEHGIPIE